MKELCLTTHAPGSGRKAEQLFSDCAAQRKRIATTKGWPDFLCQTEAGKVFAVEVKSDRQGPADQIREEQAVAMSILGEFGVPVYVWYPRAGLFHLFGPDVLDLAEATNG